MKKHWTAFLLFFLVVLLPVHFLHAQTYTISGTVTDGASAISGVTLTIDSGGSTDTTTTAGNGTYSITVNAGWRGTITPTLAGYTFAPTSSNINGMTANVTVDFVGTLTSTHVVSGFITDPNLPYGEDFVGIKGVAVTFDDGGTPVSVETSAGGFYTHSVAAGWTGTMTPTLSGYTFTPASSGIGPVSGALTRNYSGTAASYQSIGGIVSDGTPVYSGQTLTNPMPGVQVVLTTGPCSYTDENGYYLTRVPVGWSGTATPTQTGVTFTPTDISYSNVTSDQEDQDYQGDTGSTIYIGGYVLDEDSVAMEGVTITYAGSTGGTTTTVTDGYYTFEVTEGWTGTATPSTPGYTFTPSLHNFSNVTASTLSNDFEGTLVGAGTFTISGSVMTSGEVGIENVVMDGLPGTPTTDSGGNYSATVALGWSGTVTPILAGYTFSPQDATYTTVVADQSQGYAGTYHSGQFTISGTVFDADDQGLAGVTIAVSGESPITTSAGGTYSFAVNGGWVGTITPSLTGSTFTPTSRTVGPVGVNYDRQDFNMDTTLHTISGTILYEGSVGLADVTLTLSTGGSTVTASDGTYGIDVTDGWSGTITPSRSGFSFAPASLTYTVITADNNGQDYTAYIPVTVYTISGIIEERGASIANVVLNGLPGNPTTDSSGYYSGTVSSGWSGTVTPALAGYSFTPVATTYSSVTANQVNQDYAAVGNSPVISGTILDGSSNPVAGVSLAVSTGGSTVTDSGGAYFITVATGWSGTVTPALTAWTFQPAQTAYTNVTNDQTNQDYLGISSAVQYTISGTILDDGGTPVSGVAVVRSPGGDTTTAADGTYSFSVNGGWSGSVTPEMENWSFAPTLHTYANVAENHTDQDYTGTFDSPEYTVSGTVTADGVGLANVTMSGLPGPPTTDAAGNYSASVVEGWSGTVTPALGSYVFVPSARTYSGVSIDLLNQDYFTYPEIDPMLSLSPLSLNFATDGGTGNMSQSFLVSNTGSSTLNWSAAADSSWLSCSPSTGTGSGVVTVTVDASGLAAGNYGGTITVSDAGAVNSPQTVTVSLEVYEDTAPPFGDFSTPLNGSTCAGSVAVTGWALDDLGVESVGLYLQDGGTRSYIGDAVFVEGARPDVELYYPTYPMNTRAGWGYMMLTHFLPGGGNGTYTILAVATDMEGNEVTLGSKTITCDNANSVKPFGAIDAPGQGGEASGESFLNYGWVVTPMPNQVPTDGSTINIYVDGVNIGNPTYNIYREDIATLFPAYANSNGAHAYFNLDTTAYANGLHTIQWIATDDAGNSDGIGSRFFTVRNTGNGGATMQRAAITGAVNERGMYTLDNKGNGKIHVAEGRRIAIRLSSDAGVTVTRGYRVVGKELRPLPVGSTLDKAAAVFYWQPGPGFVGTYRLVFIARGTDGISLEKTVSVKIGNLSVTRIK
ncbi:MAG: BACON domain-containing protein [bacterium]|nr:BACON domain-containing protein [bacterium]